MINKDKIHEEIYEKEFEEWKKAI